MPTDELRNSEHFTRSMRALGEIHDTILVEEMDRLVQLLPEVDESDAGFNPTLSVAKEALSNALPHLFRAARVATLEEQRHEFELALWHFNYARLIVSFETISRLELMLDASLKWIQSNVGHPETIASLQNEMLDAVGRHQEAVNRLTSIFRDAREQARLPTSEEKRNLNLVITDLRDIVTADLQLLEKLKSRVPQLPSIGGLI